jgi:hypothetical protein
MSKDNKELGIRALTPEDLDRLRSTVDGVASGTPVVSALVELLRACVEHRDALPGVVRLRAAAALRVMQQQLDADKRRRGGGS